MEELKALTFHFSLHLDEVKYSLLCTHLLGFVCSVTAGFIKEKCLFCGKYFWLIKSLAGRKIQVPDKAPMMSGNTSGYAACLVKKERLPTRHLNYCVLYTDMQ